MAWVAEEDFNSYSDGDLNGNNGGSGWSGAWSGHSRFDVTSSLSFDGGKSAFCTTGNATFTEVIERSLTTATTSGVVYFCIRCQGEGSSEIRFVSSSGNDFIVSYYQNSSSGYLRINGGSSQNIIGNTFAADTWYTVEVTYNTTTSTVTARAKPAGGAWTSSTANTGSYYTTGIDKIQWYVEKTDTKDYYLDSISASEPTYHDPIVTFTTTDGVKMGDVLSSARVFLLTLTDGLKLGDIITSLKYSIATILDGLKIGDVFSSVLDGIARWTNRTKPSTTFTNRTKPSTSFTDRTKPTTTWTKVDRG